MFFSYQHIVESCTLSSVHKAMSYAFINDVKRLSNTAEKTLIYGSQPQGTAFISMPALDQMHGIYINKVGSIFTRKQGETLPTIHAQVLAFCSHTGKPLAILDGRAITNLKCASISAYVTDFCASKDAKILAVIGAGDQAKQQIRSVLSVRNINRINLYNRSAQRLNSFRDDIVTQFPNVDVHIYHSIEEAVNHADIIGTATSSGLPIYSFENLKPDVHINCMGAHSSESREIPHQVLRDACLIVEDRKTATLEAGGVHCKAIEVFELHHLNKNELQSKMTIFSSTGYALLDAITTAEVLGLTSLKSTY